MFIKYNVSHKFWDFYKISINRKSVDWTLLVVCMMVLIELHLSVGVHFWYCLQLLLFVGPFKFLIQSQLNLWFEETLHMNKIETRYCGLLPPDISLLNLVHIILTSYIPVICIQVFLPISTYIIEKILFFTMI